MVEPETWMRDAACRGMDPQLFVPDYNPESKQQPAPIAYETCKTCKVTRECLAYGKKYKCSGCWGGIPLQHGRRRNSED